METREPPAAADGQLPGMRERKKACTRQRLLDAALGLFETYGFESTTVEVIAARADVHPRTFFRHFATKEDVVVTENRARLDHILNIFIAQPEDVPVLTALRRASAEGLGHYRDDRAGLQLQLSLIATVPALQAANLEASLSWQRSLTAEVARRLNVDPAHDLRAKLIATTTLSVFGVSVETWLSDPNAAEIDDLVDEAFTVLEAGLGRSYASPRPERPAS